MLSLQPADQDTASSEFKESPAGNDGSSTPKQSATWCSVLALRFSSLPLKILQYIETVGHLFHSFHYFPLVCLAECFPYSILTLTRRLQRGCLEWHPVVVMSLDGSFPKAANSQSLSHECRPQSSFRIFFFTFPTSSAFIPQTIHLLASKSFFSVQGSLLTGGRASVTPKLLAKTYH